MGNATLIRFDRLSKSRWKISARNSAVLPYIHLHSFFSGQSSCRASLWFSPSNSPDIFIFRNSIKNEDFSKFRSAHPMRAFIPLNCILSYVVKKFHRLVQFGSEQPTSASFAHQCITPILLHYAPVNFPDLTIDNGYCHLCCFRFDWLY